MTERSTPYDAVVAVAEPRRLLKSEVLAVCRRLEGEALGDPPAQVVATIQDVRFASANARDIWTRLAAAGTAVTVYGRDLPAYVAPGVPGVALDDDDPLVDLWCLLVRWPDGRAAAMTASDVAGIAGIDGEAAVADERRDFDLVATEDPTVVGRCFDALRVPAGS